MNSEEKRSRRIAQLTTKFVRLIKEQGKTPQEALSIIQARANQMASPPVARGYVQEVIRRVNK